MKDDIEKFFFKNLKSDTLEDESWNTPSEKAWNILRTSRDKKKDNKYYFLIWFVLLSGTFSLFYTLYSLHLLKEEIAAISKKQDSFSDNENIYFDGNENINTNSIVKTSGEKENRLNPVAKKRSFDINSDKSPIGLNNKSASFKKPNYQVNDQLLSVRNTSLITREESINEGVTTIYDKGNFNNINEVDRLKSTTHSSSIVIAPLIRNNKIPFVSTTKSAELNREINLEQKDQHSTLNKVARNRKMKIGFYLATTFSAIPIKEVGLKRWTSGSERFQLTSSYGIEMGHEITKDIYITGGVLYQGIRYNMNSGMSTTYDKSTEFINSAGQMENTQNIAIPSAIGDLYSEIRLSHPPAININDNTPFEYKVDIEQQLHIISIPIGVEHQLNIGKELNFNSGVGVSWNRLIKNKLDMNSSIIMEGERVDFKSTNEYNIELNNFINYYLELGLSYSIKQNSEIFFKANYFRNLSSIRISEEISSRIHGVNLKLGFSKKL